MIDRDEKMPFETVFRFVYDLAKPKALQKIV